jgi:prepilin-type N-terminal cleavage/methylation domain-containing protein
MERSSRACAGFTLVELLTAMAIVTLLAGISVPIVLSIIQGDKVRDASSSVQATITAARERAALDNRMTGIRLIPDPANPELVRQIVFIREAEPIAPGGSVTGGAMVTNRISALRYGATGPFFNDTVEVQFDRRFVQTIIGSLPAERISIARYNLPSVLAYRGFLRLNGTGPYVGFSFFPDGGALPNLTTQTLSIPAGVAENRSMLLLDVPLTVELGSIDLPVASSGVRIEIVRPPVPLEGAEPLQLPQGIVIDLGQLPRVETGQTTTTTRAAPPNLRLSRITPRLPFGNLIDAGTGAVDFSFDIMFGTDRNVVGSSAVDDRVILWVRDENAVLTDRNPNSPTGSPNETRKEIRAESPNSNSLVVLSTRTGQIGTYKPILLDKNGDGFADWDQYYTNVDEGVGVND